MFKLREKELSFRIDSVLRKDDLKKIRLRAIELQRDYSDSVRAQETALEALIVSGASEQAADQIRRLQPMLTSSVGGRRLLAWESARRGDIQMARLIWRQIARDTYIPSLHAELPAPKPLTEAPAKRRGDSPILFSCIRNEREFLPWFLQYYRSAGVEEFFMIDNASSDGTREYLHEQPDVHLFSADENFFAAGGGMLWVNQLVQRYGRESWCLYLDTDEMLVTLDGRPPDLKTLCRDLQAGGAEILPGVMIDMYCDDWDRCASYRQGDDPLDYCRYFDTDYFRYGSVESPYLEVGGGFRTRLFKTSEKLRKTPLFWGGAGVRYLNSHSTLPGVLSSGVLPILHFKMLRQYRAFHAATKEHERARITDRSQAAKNRHRAYDRFFMHPASPGSTLGESSEVYREGLDFRALEIFRISHESL